MAEWLKAAVLKTVVRQRTAGSNPAPSAISSLYTFKINYLISQDELAIIK
jgi:hypothetical protein